MNNILIVADMQNDFIYGVLGSAEAKAIIPAVAAKIQNYINNNDTIIFTQDTHDNDYIDTMEGKQLPPHCIKGSYGWSIIDRLDFSFDYTETYYIYKESFGYHDWGFDINAIGCNFIDNIEICGLYTDTCVVSNALILRALFPNTNICVDSNCCAGTSPQKHEAALQVMRSCLIKVS